MGRRLMNRAPGTDPASGDGSTGRRVEILVSLMRHLSLEPDPETIIRLVNSAMRQAYGPWAVIILSVRGLKAGEYAITRFITPEGRELISGPDPWYGSPEGPVGEGGFLGALIADATPQLRTGLAIGEDPVLGDALRPYRALVAVPVYELGEIDNWVILAHVRADGFREIDLEWGLMRANLIGAMVSHKVAHQRLQAASARIQQEVDNIAALQEALLPPVPDPRWGLCVASHWRSYDRAGGDYYDFVPLPDLDGRCRLAIIVADASGHGPSAAVIVAMLHVILHSLVETGTPSAILEEINRRLFERRVCNVYVTALLGIYEPEGRRLTYASAGHPPPLLRRAAGAVRAITSRAGIPLGVLDRVGADDRQLALDPGDVLVLYTDGITEARNEVGEQFQEAGVRRALEAASGPPEAINEVLLGAVARHEAGRQPTDDKLLLVIGPCG